jgi:hypothetical protein
MVVLGVVAAYAVGTVVARKRGYNMGGEVPVRCRDGHVFTTIWIPGVSVKSLRLGWRRLQWCPVGGHWSVVTPLRDVDLTTEERESAAQHHDRPIP